MTKLSAAISFLSLVALGKDNPKVEELGTSTRYFPLVGLLFGLVLAGSAVLLQLIFPHRVVSAILLIILPALSGGLHLDALADTADGLLGGWSRADSLRIMKDSAVGVFGAAAVTLNIILKYALLSSLKFDINGLKFIIIMPALSRWAPVYASYFYPAVRSNGLAKAFSRSVGVVDIVIASLLAAVVTLILFPVSMALAVLIGFAVMIIVTSYILTKKIGGVTGDILGTLIELGESLALLIAVLILWR